MSCSRFSANQLRLLLHAAAYVLLPEAKTILFRGSELARADISTFRERVILTAVKITELKTKIKVEYVRNHPIRDGMRRALRLAS